MEELKKICCTEAERTQPLRVDDLSQQDLKESQSTVNQLRVQIQELQSKVNSVIWFQRFPWFLRQQAAQLLGVIFESLAAILARSLIHRTHVVHRETFFEYPPAPAEPTASFFSTNVYARSPTATRGEPVSLNTGRAEARIDERNRDTRSFTIPTPRFAAKVQLGILPLMWKELIHELMVEQPRNQVSDMHFDKFLNPSTFQSW